MNLTFVKLSFKETFIKLLQENVTKKLDKGLVNKHTVKGPICMIF